MERRYLCRDFVFSTNDPFAILQDDIAELSDMCQILARGNYNARTNMSFDYDVDDMCGSSGELHDDVIKWKHFPRYWPFVRGIHPPHKSQWRGALMFSLICARINGWVKNGEAGYLRRYHVHYDVIVMRMCLA